MLKIECESISKVGWTDGSSDKTCYMREKTIIDSPHAVFSQDSDKTVTAVFFHNNKKIFYLPVQLDSSFPSLFTLGAAECSIKELSKNNFRNLKKLRKLWLERNHIEQLPKDVFKDLVSIEELLLGMKSIEIKSH